MNRFRTGDLVEWSLVGWSELGIVLDDDAEKDTREICVYFTRSKMYINIRFLKLLSKAKR